MLAVAHVATPPDMSIDWHQASADSLPFADGSFDVVLCQMGLQFFPGQLAALREMHRVLDAGGRAYVTVPGPRPAMFAVMTDARTASSSPMLKVGRSSSPSLSTPSNNKCSITLRHTGSG
jgi:ubiquinone/menaquinone biosynthesis C-methylase UbiE